MESRSKQPGDKVVSGQQQQSGGGGQREDKRKKGKQKQHHQYSMHRPCMSVAKSLLGLTTHPAWPHSIQELRQLGLWDMQHWEAALPMLPLPAPNTTRHCQPSFIPRLPLVLHKAPHLLGAGGSPGLKHSRDMLLPPGPRGLAPGLLDPLVEGIGVLGKLLAQLVVLLLPPLFLLQLQLPLLRAKGGQILCTTVAVTPAPPLHRWAQDGWRWPPCKEPPQR